MIGRCRDIRVRDSLSVNRGVRVVWDGIVDGCGHLVWSGLLLLLNVMRGEMDSSDLHILDSMTSPLTQPQTPPKWTRQQSLCSSSSMACRQYRTPQEGLDSAATQTYDHPAHGRYVALKKASHIPQLDDG